MNTLFNGMRGKPVVWLVIVILATACEKDVYIRIKDSEHKLVVSGLLFPDSALVVHVSQTIQASVTGPADTTWSGWDTLIIYELRFYENDQFIGDLERIRGSFYGLPDFRPVPGSTYRIEASAGERKPVSATTIVPYPVEMNSFDTTLFYEEGLPVLLRATIGLSDRAAEKNYYALQVAVTAKYYDWQEGVLTDSLVTHYYQAKVPGRQENPLEFIDFLNGNDPIYFDRKLFFTDDLFSGRSVDLTFDLFDRNPLTQRFDTVKVSVELEQVDQSYYFYAVSYRKYVNTYNMPFTEPVQVYSNVKDGYGLFTSYTSERREFTVVWNDR